MKWCRVFRIGLYPESEGWWFRVAQRHASRCAECREWFERERTLVESLRRTVPPAPPELPPFLKGRILANIENAGPSAGEETRWGWRRLQPWAVAVVALALLVGFWPRPGLDVTRPDGWVSTTTVDPVVPDLSVAAWPIDSSQVLQWAELAGQPLQGELQNAMDDGRRLFAAALLSVVPDATAETILAHTDSWLVSDR